MHEATFRLQPTAEKQSKQVRSSAANGLVNIYAYLITTNLAIVPRQATDVEILLLTLPSNQL
jgi:hypothetical protein